MADGIKPGDDLGGYRIEAVAGRGGMGVVYRATQRSLDRIVALKLVAPEMAADDTFRERFERESRVLASIDHPNVIPVYEADEVDGQLLLSMRWVEGTDLARLASGPRMDVARVVALIEQVAGALDAAHAAGLVHRDVKPANVLIEARGDGEHVYLTDFGLSKRVGSGESLTGTGQWVGTLDYVAPEQIEGKPVDARVDVYALGCVLYQALTGEVPFQRDSEAAKLWAHMQQAPPGPTMVRGDVPDAFDAVVRRALAKDPNERFPSAGDLARAAAAAAGQTAGRAPERSVAVGAAAPPARPHSSGDIPTAAGHTTPSGQPPSGPVTDPPAAGGGRRRAVVGAGAGLAALVAVAVVLALSLGSGDDDPAPAAPKGTPVEVSHFSIGKKAAPLSLAADSTGAFVVDSNSGRIVKVDGATGENRGSIDFGDSDPRSLVHDQYDNRLWVALRDTDRVAGIDLENGRALCYTPAGKKTAARPKTATNRRPPCPKVQDQPSFLSVLPNDRLGVLSMRRNGSAYSLVNTKSVKRATKPREIGGAPSDLVAGFTGAVGLFAFPPTLAAIDLQGKDSGDPLKVTGPKDISSVAVEMELGKQDSSIAWVVFTGTESDDPRGYVQRVNLSTRKPVGRPIRVGRSPNGIVVDDDGVVWVANRTDGTVTRIQEKTGRVIDSIKVGRNTGLLAVADKVVWVSGERDLIRIRPKG